MLLLLRLPHQVQLLLTDCAHTCKAFVGDHQLAVTIPELTLCGQCMVQDRCLTLCRIGNCKSVSAVHACRGGHMNQHQPQRRDDTCCTAVSRHE